MLLTHKLSLKKTTHFKKVVEMESFNRKNIVITGAAQGLGKELATLFAGEGANLALVDINDALLKETEKALSKDGIEVRSYACNLANVAEIESVCAAIKSDFSQVDVLVNNAGIVTGKYITDLTYEEIRLTIDVDLVAVMMMTKQFLTEMMERNSGYIVNVSSVMGLIGAPKMGDYAAAKHGVIGFSDSLRLELKKKKLNGVKLTIVCPSIITTGMFAGFKTNFFNPPLRPEYVAKQIIFAMKKEKAYIRLPRLMTQLPLVKALPTHASDFVLRITGAISAMDSFTGRKS